jgi:hypothetical protein
LKLINLVLILFLVLYNMNYMARQNQINNQLDNPQLLSPNIRDNNGNTIIGTSATTSAVNQITLKNNTAGNAPEVQATGADTNIGINLVTKGTGPGQLNGVNITTLSNTQTFTNKAFDANGTGNTISNLETADFASGVIQTTISGSSTNTQIPTALAVNTLVNNATTGLFDDRGNYDASTNTFPSSGGSGTAGAVLKGDVWRISVAGTLGGTAVGVGDFLKANIDSPGTTLANWSTWEGNNTYTADGTTLSLTGGQFAQIANSTNQRVNISKAGTSTGTRKQINFIEGSNVTITTTDNAGSDRVDVTVSATAGGSSFAYTEVTVTTQSASVNNGYILNNAGLVTVTLPTTANIGDTIRLVGKGTGGWRLAQNASQQVHYGTLSTTTGVGGRIDSTQRRDTLNIVCITANNEWQVLSSVGNVDII